MGPVLLQIRTPPLSRVIYCCKLLGSGLIIQLIKDTHKQQTDIVTNLSNAINFEVSGNRQNPTSFDFIVESNSCNNYTLDSIMKNKNIFYSLLLLLIEEVHYNHQNPYINLTIHILVFLKINGCICLSRCLFCLDLCFPALVDSARSVIFIWLNEIHLLLTKKNQSLVT